VGRKPKLAEVGVGKGSYTPRREGKENIEKSNGSVGEVKPARVKLQVEGVGAYFLPRPERTRQ